MFMMSRHDYDNKFFFFLHGTKINDRCTSVGPSSMW